MKLAIINLPTEEARWRAVSEQFTRLGLQPLRLPAIAEAQLAPSQRELLYSDDLNRRQYHRPLCVGEIGCYASHMAAWRALLESGDRCLAVFEDDVEVDDDLPEVLDAIARRPQPWDMVKLIGRSQEKLVRHQPLCGTRTLVGYRRVPSLTGAYLLHRRGAAKLLQRRVPFGRPIDVDLRHWWECDLAVHGVYPYPVHEAPLAQASTIDGAGERTAGARWRKLRYQALYSWDNWLATGRALRSEGRRLEAHAAEARHDAA